MAYSRHGPRSRSSCNRHAGRLVARIPFATTGSSNWGTRGARSRITYVGEWAGAVYPDGIMPGVYDELTAPVQAMARARRLPCLEFAADREGLPHWGMTSRTRHAARGRSLSREYRQGGDSSAATRGCGRSNGLRKRLVQFKLKSPEPLLYHNEPIWKGDSIVGSSVPACTGTPPERGGWIRGHDRRRSAATAVECPYMPNGRPHDESPSRWFVVIQQRLRRF